MNLQKMRESRWRSGDWAKGTPLCLLFNCRQLPAADFQGVQIVAFGQWSNNSLDKILAPCRQFEFKILTSGVSLFDAVLGGGLLAIGWTKEAQGSAFQKVQCSILHLH